MPRDVAADPCERDPWHHASTAGARPTGATKVTMYEQPSPNPAPIEDLLRDPLVLAGFRVADAPVRYRAIELAGRRFAWTVPPFLRPRARGIMPSHYALTLELSTLGYWRVVEAKAFEWADYAERWARSLWRDALAEAATRPAAEGASEG